MAEWDTAYINDLPDSAFAYIESGGTKDGDGRTTPRALRHFPIRNAAGALDAAHVRNALARLSQSPFGAKARPRVEAAARSLGIGDRESVVNIHLLRAVAADVEDALSPVAEAGRIFSAANETALRAVATAINALLAQVQQAPVAGEPQMAQPGQVPGQAPAAATAVPVRQSIGDTDITDHSGMAVIAQEAVVPLSEAAKGGRGLIKVIDAGWGTSGYYGRDVLERDAPVAWPAGTKMFWDHPTALELKDRPERSLRDLAAETTGPAGWMDAGPEGPGVYAPASIFAAYRPAIEELKDHIGASIRTYANVRQGEAEGRRGSLIERLLPSPTNTIDFVTIPGRGGKVAALFEAARGQNIGTGPEDDTVSEAEIKAAQDATAAAEARATAAEERAQRAETAAAIAAARGIAGEALGPLTIPDAAKAVVMERVTANPPIKDGALDADALRAAIATEAAAEQSYIDRLTGRGRVRGMGSGEAVTESVPDMSDSFKRIGMSESAAKTAAAGRSH